MNILLINPTHPAVPHISAMRAHRFACELAELGHRVALLCAAHSEDVAVNVDGPSSDWDGSYPYIWVPAVDRPRQPHSNPLLQKTMTVGRMLTHGGPQGDWYERGIASVLAASRQFRPDVIWATFGKMESLFVARVLSQRLRVPWILDVKDNWELFVPHGLRRIMTMRTRGWSTVTVNSVVTQDKVRRWQGVDARLIYSGVDDAFLVANADQQYEQPVFRINLIGSLYFVDRLRELLEGLQRWLETLSPDMRQGVALRYLGSDTQKLREAISSLEGEKPLFECTGYQTIDRMAALCRSSAINCYIAHEGTFHHKLLELLACGRPVLAYPFERDESWRLVKEVGGYLLTPSTPESMTSSLQQVHAQWCIDPSPAPNKAGDLYSWRAQARILESVLTHVAVA